MTRSSVALILSGQYCGQELASELGWLPPAFLPVKNRRLYELQVDQLRPDVEKEVYLTLPAGFDVSHSDLRRLSDLRVHVVFTDRGLSLREAVVRMLARVAEIHGADCGVEILLGDTLIPSESTYCERAYFVAEAAPEYEWSIVDLSIDGRVVGVSENREPESGESALVGYFNFDRVDSILEQMAAAETFADGLNRYAESLEVRAIHVADWYDFGHGHTYFSARKLLTTERVFNRLDASGRGFIKRSTKPARMEAEARWYECLPNSMKVYTPQYLGRVDDGYEIEYLHLSTLSDLYVFGDLARPVWRTIVDACFEFCDAAAASMSRTGPSSQDLAEEYRSKTNARLAEYAAQGGDTNSSWSVNGESVPSLYDVANIACDVLRDAPERAQTLIHGDLCMSNILFDPRTRGIKVIDPRGEDMKGNVGNLGDPYYDLAKLAHSFEGGYDAIVAGRAILVEQESRRFTLDLSPTKGQEAATSAFRGALVGRLNSQDADRHLRSIRALMITLFASMLPLHYDSPHRQLQLHVNTLRLYTEFL